MRFYLWLHIFVIDGIAIKSVSDKTPHIRPRDAGLELLQTLAPEFTLFGKLAKWMQPRTDVVQNFEPKFAMNKAASYVDGLTPLPTPCILVLLQQCAKY